MVRNAEQSSRNTKHDYLLRKLARCGECDSPLFGTAYHGKLYYVCGNRHRTFPLKKECKVGSFKAGPLEDAVWRKVCEAVSDPALILSQIGKIKERAARAQAGLRKELADLAKRIEATGKEEKRVLQAYREEVISLGQLRSEIAAVNESRARLAGERQSVLARLDGGSQPTLGRDDAADYCELVQKRLADLNGDFEAKRRILGLLVNKIVVQGKSVRIKGIIPASAGEGVGESGRIASTTS
jgi:hypothetical protein